ncbi:MAG: hypothetical protein LBT27_00700 [Prevotellaceae bacterium]|jgi:hypothetical protein|nr:hypothetical protein [Prevotellaceae bacterium]
MKKMILCIIGLIMLSMSALRAADINPDKYWVVPAVYAMDEEITWYFDFGSTQEAVLPNGSPLFLWIWAPSNPTGNPVPMNYEGNRIWSITLTPTLFFGMTSADIYAHSDHAFNFLLRSANFDDYHTGTLVIKTITDYVGDFATSGKIMSYYSTENNNTQAIPGKNVYPTSNVSVLFNANLAPGFADAVSGAKGVHMHGGYNNFADHIIEYHAWETGAALCSQPQSACYTEFKHLGNGIYKKDFVPYLYFGALEEDEFNNFEFLFVQDDWTATNADATGNYVILAAGVPVPPPPSLYFFPVKISLKDILVITREYNNRGQFLSYSVTGGTKTITGDLSGAAPMAMQRAFVNIAEEFKGMNISKLTVVIKDQNNNEIYSGDIPLVTVD